MLLKIAGATVLAAGAGLASMDYVVVDVKPDREGPRLIVPIPLLAAEAAVQFIPPERLRVDVGKDAERFLPVAREVMGELRAMPDTDIVTVEDGDTTVRVGKRSDRLEVRVHDGGRDQVDVDVPIECLEKVLESLSSGHVDVGSILSALHKADGKLVDVHDGDQHVSVWVW